LDFIRKNNRKSLFEFYYLTELSHKKIKPLSRWEKLLDEKSLGWLKYKGFYTEIIPRKTILGKTVYETVFSNSSHYLDFYKKKFYNISLKKSEASQKLEGFLFGYPSCCINQFIRHPYHQNNLSKNQQRFLFHWACPNCRITPELVPYYEAVYNKTEEWFNYHFPDKCESNVFVHYQKKIQSAAAAILLSAGLTYAQSNSNDTTHYIPLQNDSNLNGLTYAEEIYLGAYDDGTNMTCHQFGLFYKMLINSLPTIVQTDQPYKEDHLMRGVIMCPKCGLYVNMGYVKIINPQRKLELDIPYLGLHFMEFGHFSYGSDSSFSRVDIEKMKKILFPYNAAHMLPVTGDSDGDALTDEEEDSLAYNYNNYDSDGDGVSDGAQLAEELIRLFPKLKEAPDNIHSHIEFFPLWGSENCQVCGSLHNMGLIEVTNPENKTKLQVNYIALHAMANGSFAYNGTVHQNERIDAVALTRIMKTHTVFIDNDPDEDGLTDNEEQQLSLNLNHNDSNNNGVTDARELALKFIDTIKTLPTEPRTDGSYIEYVGMDGVQLCSVCGKEVIMGIMKIYNPLINTIEPLVISSYAFHFLENGSFEHEYLLDWEESNRIDPILLSNYLNIPITGIKEEFSSKPHQFALYQNYPNPFNPSTKIKFSIPLKPTSSPLSGGLVTLKVFDLLGREVATLVNKEKPAGTYEVEFDANNLPSGIYFYRLRAGGFSDTKKFIIIR